MVTEGSEDSDIACVAESVPRNMASNPFSSVLHYDQMLLGLEKLNRTRWVQQWNLGGVAPERMASLRAWHKDRLRVTERLAIHMLCRHFVVGIGAVDVSGTITMC